MQYDLDIHVSFDQHEYEKDHDKDVMTWDALTRIDDWNTWWLGLKQTSNKITRVRAMSLGLKQTSNKIKYGAGSRGGCGE